MPVARIFAPPGARALRPRRRADITQLRPPAAVCFSAFVHQIQHNLLHRAAVRPHRDQRLRDPATISSRTRTSACDRHAAPQTRPPAASSSPQLHPLHRRRARRHKASSTLFTVPAKPPDPRAHRCVNPIARRAPGSPPSAPQTAPGSPADCGSHAPAPPTPPPAPPPTAPASRSVSIAPPRRNIPQNHHRPPTPHSPPTATVLTPVQRPSPHRQPTLPTRLSDSADTSCSAASSRPSPVDSPPPSPPPNPPPNRRSTPPLRPHPSASRPQLLSAPHRQQPRSPPGSPSQSRPSPSTTSTPHGIESTESAPSDSRIARFSAQARASTPAFRSCQLAPQLLHLALQLAVTKSPAAPKPR